MDEFVIAIPDDDVIDLWQRIAAARWSDEPEVKLPGISFQTVRRLAETWRDTFDWREQEHRLNRHRQVVTDIDGQRLHAVQVSSDQPRSIAVALLHGWPSTFAEYLPLVDCMAEWERANGTELDVDIVIPSLPGYGFSTPLAGGGWDAEKMAGAVADLLTNLGYERFILHGGDVGLEVATALARQAPRQVLGLHLNLGGVRLTAENQGNARPEDPDEARALDQYRAYSSQNAGYAQLQSTRPMTAAYALTDSPIGQLAWIAEKFLEWSDPRQPVSDDQILTATSIYWFTRSAGSAARFYQESFGKWDPAAARIEIPAAVAAFPSEIVCPVRRWAQERFAISQWTDMPAGGHFSALERPDLLADSLGRFITSSTVTERRMLPDGSSAL